MPSQNGHPTVGVLAGWQFYRTATSLNYLNPLYSGIRAAARDYGCNLLLGCGMGATGHPRDPLRPAWPVLLPDTDFVPIGPWNTDGLIVANPLESAARSRYLQDLRAAGHPIVFVGGGEAGPTIVADNQGGILQAIKHLVEHGHRRIAFLAGNPQDFEGDAGERLRAYRKAIPVYGLADDPALMANGMHSYDGGLTAMQELLDRGVPFTAVLASNDESAMGAMRILKENGRKIPDEVAIVGFDDRLEAIAQVPPLTSVHLPLFKMGYNAVELLLQGLADPTAMPARVQVPTRLVVHQSCGCRYHPEPAAGPALAADREQLEEQMADAVLAESRLLSAREIRTACHALLQGFEHSLAAGEATAFQAALETVLAPPTAQDDAHVWQVALSLLQQSAPGLLAAATPAAASLVPAMVDQARLTISDSLRRLHRRYLADQKTLNDRLDQLTSRLLQTLDEAQIFEVLAQHLPDIGQTQTCLGVFEAEGDDPVAWTVARTIQAQPAAGPPTGVLPPSRLPTRQFPWPEVVAPGAPFSQVLVPLFQPGSVAGFMAFEAVNLEVYGAIVQQVAAALNSAQLYRAATEGRRLAEEANQLKTRFLSMVSHELRTPLNLIVGLSDLVLRDKGEAGQALPPGYRKDLERIHASGEHLGWLIRDVLDLASSEAGQLRLTNEVLDLGETLQLAAETGRQMAREKGLGWQATLPEAGPWVWGDRTRLRQVALNLITNAIKFTAQGEVRLEVEEGPGTVTVSVADTGLGIPPEEQALIFDEFHRSERATARGYGGLGLGLAICKRLVDLHGGQIAVKSSGQEGAGSTFAFTLPTVEPVLVQADARALDLATGQAVLLLTHRAGQVQRLLDQLRQRQVEVRVLRVDETPHWLSQLMLRPPDLVLVDIDLAPTQGWELVKSLKGTPATRHLPTLFCALAEAGGTVLELDYLTKPIEAAGLAQALLRQGLTAEAEDDPNSAARKTVLIVDDDLATLEMQARLVQTQSTASQVLTARNGREALAVLAHQRPDLILLDLLMPELDGFGVLEALRAQDATRNIPVIVLTGQTLTERDMARLNRGVATVLSKGMFSVDETLAHVEAALARRRKLSGEAQRLVRLAMAYLHAHYTEPLSRDALARYVGLSDDYLTYCFRQELGMTPIAYLNRYRIAQAKLLLKETGHTITEIALAVGFSDSGYFSRIFRRETGLSPDAFRHL